MKKYKCPNCGSNLIFDDENKVGTCKYCDSIYTLNDLNENFSNETKEEPKISVEEKNSSRPKLSIPILVVLFIFFPFAGIIYLAYILYQQSVWDKKHK